MQGGVMTFQMHADPEDLDWNIVVHSTQDFRSLDDRDFVKVRGTVLGELEGENAFGATVTAVEVEAESVDPATRTKRGSALAAP